MSKPNMTLASWCRSLSSRPGAACNQAKWNKKMMGTNADTTSSTDYGRRLIVETERLIEVGIDCQGWKTWAMHAKNKIPRHRVEDADKAAIR